MNITLQLLGFAHWNILDGEMVGETKQEEIREQKEKLQEENKSEDEEEGPSVGTTVFVKNLNFDTTDESLFKKFSSKFKVRSAIVSKKRGMFSNISFLSLFKAYAGKPLTDFCSCTSAPCLLWAKNISSISLI